MSHDIQILDSELSFPAQPGLSVVDAALRAGIELPYSCRKGVCASCIGRVVQGEAQPLGTLPLRNEACGPGQVLLCQCRSVPGLTIAPMRARRIDAFAPRRLQAKVYRNTLAAPDVSVLELRLPAGQRMKFRAGQYVHVHLVDGSTRSFSLANPPQRNDGLTLHVRHVPGGRFSSTVPAMARGQTLEVEGPYGSFTLDEGGPRQDSLCDLLQELCQAEYFEQLPSSWRNRCCNFLLRRPLVIYPLITVPGNVKISCESFNLHKIRRAYVLNLIQEHIVIVLALS